MKLDYSIKQNQKIFSCKVVEKETEQRDYLNLKEVGLIFFKYFYLG